MRLAQGATNVIYTITASQLKPSALSRSFSSILLKRGCAKYAQVAKHKGKPAAHDAGKKSEVSNEMYNTR